MREPGIPVFGALTKVGEPKIPVFGAPHRKARKRLGFACISRRDLSNIPTQFFLLSRIPTQTTQKSTLEYYYNNFQIPDAIEVVDIQYDPFGIN